MYTVYCRSCVREICQRRSSANGRDFAHTTLDNISSFAFHLGLVWWGKGRGEYVVGVESIVSTQVTLQTGQEDRGVQEEGRAIMNCTTSSCMASVRRPKCC